MATSNELGTYLNDHLGGSALGISLARKLEAQSEDPAEKRFFSELATDIEEDRDVLVGMIDRLGFHVNRFKKTAGWLIEKLSRVKINEAMAGRDLKRLLECETLSLGIEGRRALWLALEEIATDDGVFAGIDLPQLAKRAKSQRSALEPFRLAAARRAVAA